MSLEDSGNVVSFRKELLIVRILCDVTCNYFRLQLAANVESWFAMFVNVERHSQPRRTGCECDGNENQKEVEDDEKEDERKGSIAQRLCGS